MTEFPNELITAINNHRLAINDFEAAKSQPGISTEELMKYFEAVQNYAGVLAVYEAIFTPGEITAARGKADADLDGLLDRLRNLGGNNA